MRIILGASFSIILGLAGNPLAAQEIFGAREFLADHEITLIREVQEPNARIQQYLTFARLRLELIRQQLAEEKPGRSRLIHRNLHEYGRIIETIDIVADGALVDGVDLTEGLAQAIEMETEFLGRLQQVEEHESEDAWRWEFVLADAVEITRDSLELSRSDAGLRAETIRGADKRERAERDATMTPERRDEVQKKRDEEKAAEEERKRKRPTLLKKGEEALVK